MNWDVKLLSAQRCWSNTSNRKQALFFHSIQLSYYLHDHVKHYYDMDLLPIFKSEISKSSSIPTLFVFHLMGSHSDFKDRYPASFTRFQNKQIMNDEKTPEMQNTQKMTNSHVDEYDNSIAYTDFLLGCILDEHQKWLAHASYSIYLITVKLLRHHLGAICLTKTSGKSQPFSGYPHSTRHNTRKSSRQLRPTKTLPSKTIGFSGDWLLWEASHARTFRKKKTSSQ